MTIDDWFTWAAADADARHLPALKPLLEALRQATRELRAADWNDDASGADTPAPETSAQ
jgi:hypothetical protein